MKWQEYVSKIFFFKDRRSGPIKLIARAGRPRAAGYRVISSGNSVHVTITIASSRFLPSVPPERKFASVSYARLYRMSSPSLPPSVRPVGRQQNWAKTVGNGFWSTFSSCPSFLPSFFLLFLLKFSHAKLSKKGQRNRFSLPVSEKDYVSVFGASAGFLALQRISNITTTSGHGSKIVTGR